MADVHSGHFNGPRERLADALDWIACQTWTLAHHLRPASTGTVCPDCQCAPDPGPDRECPECRARWEQQKKDEAIYGSGYEAGYLDADLRNEVFGV